MSFKVFPSDAKVNDVAYCNKGMRIWAERKGWDWNEIVRNGIDSSELELLDDEMINKVIESARKRINNE